MRALIVGATGLLGHAIYRRWSARPGWKVEGTYCSRPLKNMSPLDIRQPGAVGAFLSRERWDVVALCSSNPNVDYCQSHPEETRQLNVTATLSAAREAVERGSRIMCFSSDYVFDGMRGGYAEGDETHPLSEYGRQKVDLERGLAQLGSQAVIFRVAALFGWEFARKNFVLRIIDQLSAGKSLQVCLDQEYNPTYVDDLAEALADLAERSAQGLLHLVGSEVMTRASLAACVADTFGLDRSLLVAVPFKQLAANFTAPRPLRTSLKTDRAQSLLGRPLWSARRGLKEMALKREQWQSYAARAS